MERAEWFGENRVHLVGSLIASDPMEKWVWCGLAGHEASSLLSSGADGAGKELCLSSGET